jgi:Kef-type K+ transport system membrane component KefB
VSPSASDWFPVAARAAISIIGFQLGERFFGKNLRKTGRRIAIVSVTEVIMTSVAVFLLLMLLGYSIPLALLLASVAPATDPAATMDVVRESNSEGPVTDTVLGVAAIDDAWGVVLFSLLLVLVQAGVGQDASVWILVDGLREVGGGLLLGTLLGLPMAWLTGRVRPGELTLIESLGFVFLCSGLAMQLELSHILACMAMGATVSNLATHHERPFHAIEGVEQPFLILFFLLAGFGFDVGKLSQLGLIGLAYLFARSAGKIGGVALGSTFAGAPKTVRKYGGFCMLPQAGVALGLALMIADRYPELGSQVLSIVVGTTMVFELTGPLMASLALQRAGELPDTHNSQEVASEAGS